MSQLPRYESYKDSGVQWLGEIPSHWAVKKLKFLTSYFKGFAFKSEDFSDIGIPLIKASNVKKFSIENVESHIAFEKVQDAFDRVKLQEGDLILSTVGSLPNVLNSAVGQIAYVSSDFAGSYLNQNNVCFRSNEKVIPIFLKYFVMSSFFRRNLDVKALWIANQAYLEVLDVQNISIIFPDLEEQKIIVDFLDKRLAQVDALISKQETLLEKLAEQRVALISHAVTKGLNPDVEMRESDVEWLGNIPKHWDTKNSNFQLVVTLRL
ncbi:restriction endonuclease subunit S [Acinetobacter sp. HC8-3S]